MKQRLLLLNLALAGLILLVGWRLRSMEQSAAKREQTIRAGGPPQVVARIGSPLPKLAPLIAGEYVDVAQKLLFVPDRNPNVVVVEAAPKVMPPLPVAHGTLELGGVIMALLSENAASPHRAYMSGDNIGAFKLIAVSRDELTLEWEGKLITRRLAELMEARARSGSPGSAAPADGSPAAGSATATSIQTSGPGQPGIQLDPETRACQPGDNSPTGTVSDGYRKLLQPTPFGNSCRWQAIK